MTRTSSHFQLTCNACVVRLFNARTTIQRVVIVLAASACVAAPLHGQTAPDRRVGDSPVAKAVYEEGFGSVGSAAFLQDGSIVVADPLSAKLIFFDSAGRLVRTVGRKGEGPGEFGNLRWARPYGSDSIATYDAAQRRVSIFDRTGRFVRSVMIQSPADGFSPEAVAVTAGGQIVVRATRPVTDAARVGVHAKPLQVWLYSPAGAPATRILDGLVGEEWVRIGNPGILMMRPFAAVALIAAGGGRVYVADSAAYPIRGFPAPAGGTVRINGDRTVTASGPHIAEYREQQRAAARDGNLAATMQARVLDAIPYPAHVPALSRIMVDADGRLWAQQYPEPKWRRQTFALYSSTGVRLARVTGPERGRIVDARGDRVLVLTRDADDVTHVQIHRFQP